MQITAIFCSLLTIYAYLENKRSSLSSSYLKRQPNWRGPSDKTSKSEASCYIMCGKLKIFLDDCVFDLKVFKTFHMSLVGINLLKYYLIISNLLSAAEVQSVTPFTSYAED